MKRLVILGAGGYGRTIADIAHHINYTTVVLDDADSVHPLSSFQSYIDSSTCFIPAFGNNSFRMEWINRLGAIVDHGCILEEGVHICLGAIMKGENRIEKCSKIEAGEEVERGQYPL